MSTATKVIIAAVALLTSFAAGRWLAPETIKTVKEIVKVKEKQKVKIVEKEVHRVTTITEYPDGKKVTVIEDNSKQTSNTDTSTHTDTKSKETSEITRGTSKVTISALGGISLLNNPLVTVWGVSVTKPVFGPVAIGLWGLNNNTFGSSLGLTF